MDLKELEKEIRQKTIDEILDWIDSQTEEVGRIKYTVSREMIVNHLQEMKRQ